MLWTPPYSPDLQPIEKFWGVGKNHAADNYVEGQKMMETVRLLREGWYGTGDKFPVNHPSFKKEVSCAALVKNSIRLATEKFVPLCKGLSGGIGWLIVDPTYKKGNLTLPIDTLVQTMTKEEEVMITDSNEETVLDGVASEESF